MNSLLAFASELEQRDAQIARALFELESLQFEIESVRADAEDAAEFLASLPRLIPQLRADVRSTNAERLDAEAALRTAEEEVDRAQGEHAQLEATRARQRAEDAHADAVKRFAFASTALSRAEFEKVKREAYVDALAAKAEALAPRVRDVPVPRPELEGTIEWAAQARGALLLEHSQLVGERDAIVRQASELAAGALGEEITAVAGLRDRLARTFAEPSP